MFLRDGNVACQLLLGEGFEALLERTCAHLAEYNRSRVRKLLIYQDVTPKPRAVHTTYSDDVPTIPSVSSRRSSIPDFAPRIPGSDKFCFLYYDM